jgi:hypothetical protein
LNGAKNQQKFLLAINLVGAEFNFFSWSRHVALLPGALQKTAE